MKTTELDKRADSEKKSYRAPVLIRYGDVRDLTMGSSEFGTTESGMSRREPV